MASIKVGGLVMVDPRVSRSLAHTPCEVLAIDGDWVLINRDGAQKVFYRLALTPIEAGGRMTIPAPSLYGELLARKGNKLKTEDGVRYIYTPNDNIRYKIEPGTYRRTHIVVDVGAGQVVVVDRAHMRDGPLVPYTWGVADRHVRDTVRGLYLSGEVPLHILRHIVQAAPMPVDDGLWCLRLPTGEYSRPMRAVKGLMRRKFFRRVDPKMMATIGQLMHKLHPDHRYEELSKEISVRPFTEVDSIPFYIGSCMAETGRWGKLANALGCKASDVPDRFDQGWKNGQMPLTLIYCDEVAEVGMRANLWPVTLPNGERQWFMDRVYPAKEEARKPMLKWAQDHGVLITYDGCTGVDKDHMTRAASLPAMKVDVPIDSWIESYVDFPWLDSFIMAYVDQNQLVTFRWWKQQPAKGDAVCTDSTGGWYTPRCCHCGSDLSSPELRNRTEDDEWLCDDGLESSAVCCPGCDTQMLDCDWSQFQMVSGLVFHSGACGLDWVHREEGDECGESCTSCGFTLINPKREDFVNGKCRACRCEAEMHAHAVPEVVDSPTLVLAAAA